MGVSAAKPVQHWSRLSLDVRRQRCDVHKSVSLNPDDTLVGESCCLMPARLFSAFFRAGQVLETERFGGGIYQPSVDKAIAILRAGGWVSHASAADLLTLISYTQVHLFPEGFVNQAALHPERAFERLLPFRWGVSRILLETPLSVNILPVYLKGELCEDQ